MTTYFFYTLTNPRNSDVFYVGCTKRVSQRRLQHSYESIRALIHKEKTTKAKYILAMGCDPIFEVIDTLESEDQDYTGLACYEAQLREAMWIELFIGWGFNLMNTKWLNTSRRIPITDEREQALEQLIYIDDLEAYADGLKKLTQDVRVLISDIAHITANLTQCLPCDSEGQLQPASLKVA